MMKQEWEVCGETITPEDLRSGKVNSGPFHGAHTIANKVHTVPVKNANGCHCALRLSLENAQKVEQERTFTVEYEGYWNTFSSPKITALKFKDGTTFKTIPSIFD